MVLKRDIGGLAPPTRAERIAFIHQMLRELSQTARAANADLLVYLLEMAYSEANDLLAERSPSIPMQINGNKTTGMAVKPSREI